MPKVDSASCPNFTVFSVLLPRSTSMMWVAAKPKRLACSQR